MRNTRTLLFTATMALCAWPLTAVAQQQEDGGFMLEEAPEKEPVVITTNRIELGGEYVTSDSYKFGEYSGLKDEGLYGIGNAEIYHRSPYDGQSTSYLELYGSNLGLSSRYAHAEYGHQGTFSVYGEYDQTPHNRLEDAQTPYLGVGSTILELPGGWVPAADAPALTQLGQTLNTVHIKTERMGYGGGFSWIPATRWELSGNYHREDKDGLETVAGIFGTTGGNMRSVILPKPVDYTTQDADINLTYTGKKLRAQLNYHLSLFEDRKDNLIFLNPYTAQAAWDDSQDFNNGGLGRLAQEPDNTAHQVTLSGNYSVTPSTIVAGSFSYGRMLQDDDFLPYTVNPYLTGANGVSPPSNTPRDSLEGDVTTLHANLSVTARPLPKTHVKAQYVFDDRDNNTPRDLFSTIPNDTGNDAGDQDPITGSRVRLNKPYSRLQHRVELDGSYRVLSNTKVGAGYEFEYVDRDLTEVENTYEHTGRVKISSSPVSYADGWAEYAFSDRNGSQYVSNLPLLEGHSQAHIATLTGNALFEQNPSLRKYYIADRRKHQVKAAMTFYPDDLVTLGLSGSYSTSDYYNTLIGLTGMDYASATLDTSWSLRPDLLFSGFITYERMLSEQTGYQRGNAAIGPATPLNPALFWMVDTLDQGITAGVEAEWEAIENLLKFGFGYTFSRTVTDFSFETGAAINPGALPDLVTRLHSVGLHGDFMVTKEAVLRVGYLFEAFDTDDFALDGVDEAIPRVLTLGNSAPHYIAHVVGASINLHF
jgi:MtrB/PioB family decaheme-associated outer membrane protein